MTKFKEGDRVEYTGYRSSWLLNKTGTVESASDSNVEVKWDNGERSCGYLPESLTLLTPAITVGTRVERTWLGTTMAGEVTGIINAANVKWDKTGNINLWPIDDLAVEAPKAEKTRGQIIQELRKAAGLPEFVVGDYVQIEQQFGGWYANVSKFEGNKIYLTENGCEPQPYNNVHEFKLITPAPSTAAVATQPQPVLKYKEGNFVRFLSGEFKGRAAYIEQADKDCEVLPYLATLIDEYDGEWVTESCLEPWEPKVGERVECRDKEEVKGAGEVVAISNHGKDYRDSDVTIVWDDTNDFGAVDGPWNFEELQPSASKKADPITTFKRGDIVEVVKRVILQAPVGCVAIVEGENSDGNFDIKVYHESR